MRSLSSILFPAAVFGLAAAGAIGFSTEGVHTLSVGYSEAPSDTVTYPVAGYKLRRHGSFEDYVLDDSLFQDVGDTLGMELDTLPHLTARDTIKVPDSLKYTDPFRYRYYVALIDSLTHTIVRDSLKASEMKWREQEDTLHYRLDSSDRFQLDSIYKADSTVRAKEAFIAWYNGLSKEERKKYDYEQMIQRKLHETDSIMKLKAEKQAIKDSIIENTPRILETSFIPDSLYYKRIISWKTDPDFHSLEIEVPDTSFNKYFYDYRFRREDVNATWLGVAGSPVQPYNYFKRSSDSGLDFYTPQEAWSYSPRNLQQYNTKTPYTELAYWGTLLSTRSKESDNVHILTTQNILPELNLQILYDRWGGGGILTKEETVNKMFVAAGNYVGKKYMLNAGFIHSRATRDENGGITDPFWLRDTTIESREIPIFMSEAKSETVNNTVFLEQQLRIQLADRDSLVKDATSAFIGHSSEFSTYSRKYTDRISTQASRDFYRDVMNYGTSSYDSLRTNKLDNKVFIRLQPWSTRSVVSKLDVGAGDKLRIYYLQSPTEFRTGDKNTVNDFYLYAGVEGNLGKSIRWNAKGDYVLMGTNFADFGLQANAALNVYPFRRARKSPLSIAGHFETTLRAPDFYQQHMHLNHFSWDNEFTKISSTKVQGTFSAPYWRLYANVSYGLLAGNIYYDCDGIIRQNSHAMSVLSADLRKDFVIGNVLHLDNRILAQWSSNQEVLPLPNLAGNLRWYIQFVAAKDRATQTRTVLTMQLGANVFCNTPWYAPAWNPNLGVFHNQNKYKYTNGPIIDVFMNLQWKTACIFMKLENAGQGWPLQHADYFSANGFINTARTFKVGIWWPFYVMPGNGHSHSHDHDHGGSDAIGGGGGGRSANGRKAAQR